MSPFKKNSASAHPKMKMRPSSELVARIVKMLVVFFSGAGAITATLKFNQPLAETTGIASFFAFIALAIIDYAADREFILALYRSIKVLAALLLVAALIMGIMAQIRFAGVISAHSDPSIQARVEKNILQARISFGSLLAALLCSCGYALWKFKATRFAESRIGLLKDLTIQVGQILGDTNTSLQDRQQRAIQKCLSALLVAMELSPWQWLLRKLPVINRSLCICAVELLKPNHEKGYYSIQEAAYPTDIPTSVLDVLRWIEKNYFPVFLDEDGFKGLVDLAKGSNPKGWESRFFNFKNRGKVISITGWIGKKKETVMSSDAQKCRAFDHSYLELLGNHRFDKKDVNWAKIRSFIGCPVGPSHLDPSWVLLVTKSIPYGFVEEDAEVVVAISQLINLTLAAAAGTEIQRVQASTA